MRAWRKLGGASEDRDTASKQRKGQNPHPQTGVQATRRRRDVPF